MSTAGIDLALLAAVRKEFAKSILPGLDEESRYTGAMMKRALDVLAAQADAECSPEEVLESAGFGTPEELAAMLRNNRPEATPELLVALRAYVDTKLEISNPRFLAATRAAPDADR